MNVVSDSSPLISLGKLQALFLLEKLYGKVIVLHAVYEEVVGEGLEIYKDTFQVLTLIKNGVIVVETVEVEEALMRGLGRGEIETIVYALGKNVDLVLMDDLLARNEAKKRNLNVKGTIGVLYEAYKKGFLEWNKFQEIIQEIISRNDIWIHEDLCNHVLKRAKMLRIKNAEIE